MRVSSSMLTFVLLLGACGDGEDPTPPDAGFRSVDGGFADAGVVRDAGAVVDPSDDFFRPDHVLEVAITLSAADWALLRVEPEQIGYPKITCGDQPPGRQYNYYPGEITIDGVTVSNVGVRKKGGFGSISSSRPGLKIKPNEYVSGQRIAGLKRLTLNNNVQDPTLISQCLGYDLFRRAGVPASRCNFAHVTVNGEDLGVYSNVESIKKDFLRRHFDDPDGRLYESGGDFVVGATGGYQPKTNKAAPDCSDLPPVAAAVEAPSSTFSDEIGAVVDLDAFTTYWAMEVILDHWDGYANNRNNHFFYHDPTSDKLHFIPWGIDALFTGSQRTTRPRSVFACGRLAWRLYDETPTRDMYLAKLRTLLDTVWNEGVIVEEIARMQTLIEPIADPQGTLGLATEIAGTRSFVLAQKAVLLAELDAGPPVWPYPAGEDSCRILVGDLTATFETTWSSLDEFGGSGTMTGTITGVSLDNATVFADSGLSEDSQNTVRIFGQLDDGRFAIVIIIVNDENLLRPGFAPLDFVNIAAFTTFYDPNTDTASGGGILLNGGITFTEASRVTGAPVVGSISGQVFEF